MAKNEMVSVTDSMDMNLSKLGNSDEQGSLVGYSSQGHKESHMTWRLNNNNCMSKEVI